MISCLQASLQSATATGVRISTVSTTLKTGVKKGNPER